MKRTQKLLGIVAFLAIISFSLTGCPGATTDPPPPAPPPGGELPIIPQPPDVPPPPPLPPPGTRVPIPGFDPVRYGTIPPGRAYY